MRIVIWGTGHYAREFIDRKAYHKDDTIVAFVDNNANLWGSEYRGGYIYNPEILSNIDFERLIICTQYYKEIKEQIRKTLNIDENKVLTYFDVEDEIKNRLCEKYINSNDYEIIKVIKHYKSKSLNIYGYYEADKRKKYFVSYSSDGMPYIVFENKKMFFPRNSKFAEFKGQKYIDDVLFEQGKQSPHRYIDSEKVLRKDMVIIDAGVCEGNFALKYVDYAKKLYLIESNPLWIEALERTFEHYRDKVVICNKYLSGSDSEDCVMLDSLVKEKVDLLKMDIEGYEIEALKGGKRLLSSSSAYCCVCCYHKHDDENNISMLLKGYGYDISTSEGYMFFPYDKDIELRRGVVYGKKQGNLN